MPCSLRNLNHYPHSLIAIQKIVHVKCLHVNVIHAVSTVMSYIMYRNTTVSLAFNAVQLTSL